MRSSAVFDGRLQTGGYVRRHFESSTAGSALLQSCKRLLDRAQRIPGHGLLQLRGSQLLLNSSQRSGKRVTLCG